MNSNGAKNMKLRLLLCILLATPFPSLAKEQKDAFYLAGALYTFMADAMLCTKAYPESSNESKEAHSFFKSKIQIIENHFTAIDELSKFKAIEKAGVNLSAKRMMGIMSNGGIAKEACDKNISIASKERFPSDLNLILSSLSK